MELSGKRIGLVLSGGGVRGMAHIALLKVLEERGIKIDVISGSSIGAVVGALYASGNSTGQMLAFFKETPLFKYSFLSLNKPGFVDTEKYSEVFKKYLTVKTFEDLKIPLYVVATNLQKGDYEIFHSGELIRPLLASAALPPVFSPVTIGGQLYADGGIMNNFPLEALEDKVDFIIGSNVTIVNPTEKTEIHNALQLARRTTSLMMYAINRPKIERSHLLFEPKELGGIGVFDTKAIESAYKIGYDHANKMLEDSKITYQTSS